LTEGFLPKRNRTPIKILMEQVTMSDYVLDIKNLVKDFPGVRAVNDVSFGINKNPHRCVHEDKRNNTLKR
jgi:hypothetical protein